MFKKILLGLGLLGVVSSVNAYNFPASQKIIYPLANKLSPDNSSTSGTCKVQIEEMRNGSPYMYVEWAEPNTIQRYIFDESIYGYNGAGPWTNENYLSWFANSSNPEPISDNYLYFDQEYNAFYHKNENLIFVPRGTAVKASINHRIANISNKPVIATYNDTALKNAISALQAENATMKAKLQALETKVYSCVP